MDAGGWRIAAAVSSIHSASPLLSVPSVLSVVNSAPEPLSSRPMLRAILFDMDGLMIDTEPLYWEVGRQIAAEYGKKVSDETLRRMMGRDRLASSTIFAEETGVPLTGEQVMHRREQLMLRRFTDGGVEPMPGLREILSRFRGRLKLGVCTSSPRLLLAAALPGIGVAEYFDATTTGDEITRGKPDPQIYLATMQKLGVAPHECAVLEDAPAGAMAGKRAGAWVIAVPSPLTASEDFSRVADARVPDLSAAAALIDARLGAEA
jgi:HAD superfamily hydrolase (TIGR01509 family)